MELKILKVILWPKNKEFKYRELNFRTDKVNVITGGSGRGKSALISIIDYCLGSSKIRIPTGLIRQTTEWFGVVISFNGRQILLARTLSKGTNELSNDMFKDEGQSVPIPDEITSNYTVDDIKKLLNKVMGYADIEMENNGRTSSWEAQRPSYRNAISLNFQPQYIIANPSTLYYKADSTADREKLRIIFPYLINAIDNRTLELREELKLLKREVLMLSRELKEKQDLSQSETAELKNYFNLAKELGLLKDYSFENDDLNKEQYTQYLLQIQEKFKEDQLPTIEVGITADMVNRLTTLREREYDLSMRLSTLRERSMTLKDLNNSAIEYRKSLLIQSDRTKAVGWLKTLFNSTIICPLCGSNEEHTEHYLDNIQSVNASISELGDQVEDSVKVYSSEIVKTQGQLSQYERELNNLRREVGELEERDTEFKRSRQAVTSIFRFLGRVDQILINLNSGNENRELMERIVGKEERIKNIETEISDDKSDQVKRFALAKISEYIRVYAEIFKPEKLDANINLDIDNLTLKFISKTGARDYLWEIGSGRNFMAYHISTMLGIHEYLASLEQSKVPSFLMFDQPSQVYFPEINDDKAEIGSEDMEELKRIFQALDLFVTRTKGKVQVILLEHAGETSWKDYQNLTKVYRWRDDEEDKALIPDEWY
ncbi:DUF3732 domain-containing protein [Mucilaginibacter rubeus]|uniref:DUF3732 domain-containing protein n=1 Tax=Mucilaginibacter rubeus TaxID=2027860 RepID=A0A5C1I4Q9_9SPHI|nr:DUF3732 domain-containing protein [Mucilaginibacter rubeus]QEM12378.1 DUF3732 domain-containing protein [Mucilaginibacter rubeus]